MTGPLTLGSPLMLRGQEMPSADVWCYFIQNFTAIHCLPVSINLFHDRYLYGKDGRHRPAVVEPCPVREKN